MQYIDIDTNNFSQYLEHHTKDTQTFRFKCKICDSQKQSTGRYFFQEPYFVCGSCKSKITWSKKSKEEISQKTFKEKQTKLKKYGNSNYNNSNQQTKTLLTLDSHFFKRIGSLGVISLKEKFSNISEEEKKDISQKRKLNCLKKYGVEYIGQSRKIKERKKQTSLKHWGTENPSQSKEIKKKKENTYLKHYGVRNYFQTKESQKYRRSQYYFNNLNFDSYPELCFYIWCKDRDLNIKRETKPFSYTFKEKEYYYFPDFEIDGKYYEIKGSQFLKEDRKWQNPFDHSQDGKYEAKHQCALKNNITILYKKDYQKYIDYVNRKYGNQIKSN